MGNVLKPQDPLSFAYEPLLSPPVDAENASLRVFSCVKELKKATKNFEKERVVDGEDGSVRTFYKASIDDTSSRTKTRISVSVMECVQDSLEAIEAWKEEVKSLGEHSHPNIVKFLGYCCEDTKSLLVFEYLHNGTLDHHIYGKNEVLSWATRVKIANGIAQGVAFLHSFNNSSLYFELRMHNIMLDETVCITYVGGFRMDTDVFAFGMLGGTRPFSFTKIIDPRLEGDYPVTAAMRMGTLIQKRTEDRPTRPSMHQVLDVLNHIAEIH
ncbi:hypothetical protein HID58_089293 [Brassica napus]|uniref:Protein kinase domain-containing protein n=1 Tax=Brassica napus TaxID=3708 RepID=A0ABQ7XYL7_BRANA|nr:hypothetical protein HID58_089293 [Brassica napus]